MNGRDLGADWTHPGQQGRLRCGGRDDGGDEDGGRCPSHGLHGGRVLDIQDMPGALLSASRVFHLRQTIQATRDAQRVKQALEDGLLSLGRLLSLCTFLHPVFLEDLTSPPTRRDALPSAPLPLVPGVPCRLPLLAPLCLAGSPPSPRFLTVLPLRERAPSAPRPPQQLRGDQANVNVIFLGSTEILDVKCYSNLFLSFVQVV